MSKHSHKKHSHKEDSYKKDSHKKTADPIEEENQDIPEEVVQLSEAQILQILRKGLMREQGVLPYSSNHSFLVTVTLEDLTLPAVYKPQRGETPLYDFEWGTLCKREAAAFIISQALGWDLIPPTVLRDGKHGVGSVQFYIDHDPSTHYFSVQEDARFADTLRKLALFDYITNNADRKSGHCLIGTDGRLWAIDHGICFHVEYKLRTVIWEFAEQTIDTELKQALCQLRTHIDTPTCDLAQQLAVMLSYEENHALRQRLNRLIQSDQFPAPHPHRRNYPWPPV